MTTLTSQDTVCPICNAKITIHQIMSTSTFGQDTDFRPHPGGADPLNYVITQCDICGYSDFGHYFEQPRDISDTLKMKIRAAVKSQDKDRKKVSRMYETAAQIAIILATDPEDIANLYLRAAWCCDDQQDSAGEKSNRKMAIQYFETALQNGKVPEDRQAATIYLVGELHRRIGDIETARAWFERVIKLDDGSEGVSRLRDIAIRQRDNPQDRM